MATTYDGTHPLHKDLVRFIVGDVAAPWLLTDEEIIAVLELAGDNVNRAAAICFDAISSDIGKLLALRDAAGGAISLTDLARLYSEKAARW